MPEPYNPSPAGNPSLLKPRSWLVQLVASLTPHCHDITRLISESMERRLPLRTRLLIRLHFSICVWCKRYDGQLKLLRKYSTGFAEKGCEQGRETLPSGARERLNKTLEEISD